MCVYLSLSIYIYIYTYIWWGEYFSQRIGSSNMSRDSETVCIPPVSIGRAHLLYHTYIYIYI